MQRFFTMEKTGNKADVYVYGDITSWRWDESDVSGYSFASELKALGNVDEIFVHINSYGGEVSEGFTIFNNLRNHPAKITTICDGFACSAASIIFMAGERRIMNPLSALWIHNVQIGAHGDGNAHRKAAEESDRLTEISKQAYTSVALTLSDEELALMMNEETWIMPDDALSMGFATEIATKSSSDEPTQYGKDHLFTLLNFALAKFKNEKDDPDEDDPDKPTPDKDDPEKDDPDKIDPEKDDPDKDDPDKDDPEKEDESAAQKWSGFFNAIKNM